MCLCLCNECLYDYNSVFNTAKFIKKKKKIKEATNYIFLFFVFFFLLVEYIKSME